MKKVCWILLSMVVASLAFPLERGDAQQQEFQEISRDHPEHRYFVALRRRKLFELAELLCQRTLNDSAIPPDVLLLHRIELARTLRDHAQSVPWGDAEGLWEQAFDTLAVESSYSDRLKAETALLRAARLEQLFWLANLNPENQELSNRFEQSAQQAIQELRDVFDSMETGREFAGNDVVPELSLDEVQLALGRSYLRFAEWSAERSRHRPRLLSSARKILAGIRQSILSSETWQEAQLLLLALDRLQDDPETFERRKEKLESRSLSKEGKMRIVLEQARFLIQRDELTKAADLITEVAQQTGQLPPNLRGLRLRILARLSIDARLKGDDELADELVSEVRRRTALLSQAGYQFEAQLAMRYLREAVAIQKFGPQLAELVTKAREAVRDERIGEAQEAYASAVETAIEQGRWEQLIELAYDVANVYFPQQQYEAAARQLKTIWSSSPNFPEMNRIHLLWINSLQRAYSKQPSLERLSAYETALSDHLQRYPKLSSAQEVRWLQAELTFARRKYEEALQQYRQIPSTHERYASAQTRIFQCYHQLLKTGDETDRALIKEVVTLANQFLEKLDWEEVETAPQVEAILQAVRLLLNYETGLHQQLPVTLKKLETLFSSPEKVASRFDVTAEQALQWSQRQTIYQGILLIQQGKSQEAYSLFNQGNPRTGGEISESFFLLEQLAEIQTENMRTAEILGTISLNIIRQLKNGPVDFTDEQKRDLKLYEAEAYYNVGRLSQAIPLYEELVEGVGPNDPLIARLTELLEECDNDACFEALYSLWKKKANSARQGTDAWYRARYELARAALKTGRKKEAGKIISITTLLYPDAGTPALRESFKDLKKQLEDAR